MIRAYIGALFALAKHGQTFSSDANNLIREIADPGVSAEDVFSAIDKNPSKGFESLLKSTAHRIAKAGI